MSAAQKNQDTKSKRSMSQVSRDLQGQVPKGAASHVQATVKNSGKTTLGIDVESFVEHFTGATAM